MTRPSEYWPLSRHPAYRRSVIHRSSNLSRRASLFRQRDSVLPASCCHGRAMRTKLDIAALERSIDFDAVIQSLNRLSSDPPRTRQNSVSHLLDKVQPTLLEARQNGVSLATLVATLKGNGISVSEATLRRYLRSHGKRQKVRQQKSKTAPNPEQPPVDLPPKSPSSLPPRLARRINH